MANGSAFDDAVRISKDNPGLAVGVHISLVGERCLAPAHQLGGLVNARGELPANFGRFLKMLVCGRFSIEHIRREVDAQIRKILDSGIQPTHIDSHQHLHVFPGVLDTVLDAARSACIPVIRMPREHGGLGARTVERLFLNACCRLAARKIDSMGLNYAPHFWGFGVSGSMTESNLIETIHRLRPGTNEIMCHPGYPDSSTRARYSWGYNWEAEADALCSSAVMGLLKGDFIRLSGYPDAFVGKL